MFRNATIYLSEIIVVCKKINVPMKYIGYFGKSCIIFTSVMTVMEFYSEADENQ